MLVGVSLSGHLVRLVALRHVVPVDVLGAPLHVDRADVLCVALPFVAIDHQRTPFPELGPDHLSNGEALPACARDLPHWSREMRAGTAGRLPAASRTPAPRGCR
jgi:hypothetical protein